MRKQFTTMHRIATMYYDEPNHELYLGYTDGQVECFVPNFGADFKKKSSNRRKKSRKSSKKESCKKITGMGFDKKEMDEINKQIDSLVESNNNEEIEVIL